MADAKASVAEKVATRKKKLRPDGSEYSSNLSERYRQLVEDGKLGGPGSELAKEHGKKGGRPRKVSAQELVAEKAREEAEEIWQAVRSGLSADSQKTRNETAKLIYDIEERVQKRREREEQRAQGLGKDEIIQMLVQKLVGGGPASVALKNRLQQAYTIPDEDVEDVSGTAQLPA